MSQVYDLVFQIAAQLNGQFEQTLSLKLNSKETEERNDGEETAPKNSTETSKGYVNKKTG